VAFPSGAEQVLDVQGAVFLPVCDRLGLDFASLRARQSRRNTQKGGHPIGQCTQGSHLFERKRRAARRRWQNQGAAGPLLFGKKRQ
jgi:hypothetical protein